MRMVQMIWRGEMHHVYIRISQHIFKRVVNTRDTQLDSFLLGLFTRASHQAQDWDPVTAQALHMCRSDEPSPRHADADGLFRELFCHHYYLPELVSDLEAASGSPSFIRLKSSRM